MQLSFKFAPWTKVRLEDLMATALWSCNENPGRLTSVAVLVTVGPVQA